MIFNHLSKPKRHLTLLATTSLHAAFILASSSSSLIALSFILPAPIASTYASSSASPLSAPAFGAAPYHNRIKSYPGIQSRLKSTAAAKESDIMSQEEEITVPNIDPTTLSQLVQYATSFSAANGLQVETTTTSSIDTSSNKKQKTTSRSYITAPISLLPQSYPKSQFEHAQKLATPFNELVDCISRDGQFLKDTLKDVRDVDEYTGKLLDLYEEIYLGK